MDVTLGDIDLDSIKESVLSSVNNPFTKESIESINFNISKPFFDFNKDKGLCFTARVEFKNKMTEGKQRFEADEFMSLVAQVDEFIKML